MPKRSRGLGRVTAGQSWSQGLGVSITRAGEMQETGTFGHSRKRVHVLPPVLSCPRSCPAPGPGRPGPAARSQHYLFHGFQLTNKVTKRPKDKSMCARRDAIAQRCSPVLASNLANRYIVDPLRVQTDHPSPSAHEFRLLLNGLAASELRRMI